MTTTYSSQSTASYESIKLDIDAHARDSWVSRQVDGATPQPLQKMTAEEFMLFVVKQQKLTGHMLTGDEADARRVGIGAQAKRSGSTCTVGWRDSSSKATWCKPRTVMSVAKG